MIIDEKVLLAFPPPPSYDEPPSFAAATTGKRDVPLSLSTIPPHLLLHIVFYTIPHGLRPNKALLEEQRRALHWLNDSLRLVDRALYITCQHFLRSAYLPFYDSLVKAPYTSDPFPYLQEPSSSGSAYPRSPLNVLQRETAILDRFIALKVREDMWRDESVFHLEREENFRDLFDVSQPKARLEDLVRVYGMKNGTVTTPWATKDTTSSTRPPPLSPAASRDELTKKPPPFSPPPSPRPLALRAPQRTMTMPIQRAPSRSSIFSIFRKKKSLPQLVHPYLNNPQPLPVHTIRRPPPRRRLQPLQFSQLSITFSHRTVGLMVANGSRIRTIVTIQREGRTEKLESIARRLTATLREVLED
ncbi:hypothetical protein DL96DRAFT_1594896, partial [Flagelloscypha sp. PMI_526]